LRRSVAYLFVLVRGHSNEARLLEDVGSERGIWQFQNVVRPHQVEPRLVLVHRVEDRLQKEGRV
jgi:hypothetical protein